MGHSKNVDLAQSMRKPGQSPPDNVLLAMTERRSLLTRQVCCFATVKDVSLGRLSWGYLVCVALISLKLCLTSPLALWLKDNGHEVVQNEFLTVWRGWPNLAFKYKVRIINWPHAVASAPGISGFAWKKMNSHSINIFWDMLLAHFKDDCMRVAGGSGEAGMDSAKSPEDIPLVGFEKWSEGLSSESSSDCFLTLFAEETGRPVEDMGSIPVVVDSLNRGMVFLDSSESYKVATADAEKRRKRASAVAAIAEAEAISPTDCSNALSGAERRSSANANSRGSRPLFIRSPTLAARGHPVPRDKQPRTAVPNPGERVWVETSPLPSPPPPCNTSQGGEPPAGLTMTTQHPVPITSSTSDDLDPLASNSTSNPQPSTSGSLAALELPSTIMAQWQQMQQMQQQMQSAMALLLQSQQSTAMRPQAKRTCDDGSNGEGSLRGGKRSRDL
jgi:hypothetical protein